jgi:RNA polymerase sigma factor (sigma-70 family)
MSATVLTALIARCRALGPRCPQTSDTELLRRFARQRDAAAFTELLERHAPLVWSMCRRILPGEADCEDAFQAVFLALVRQAASLDASRPLGGWLHTVAVRVAHKALSRSRRQRTGTVLPERATPGNVADDLSSRELFRAVDEEIERLPAALRLPVILCCLEGRTRDEAAERMACSLTAVKGRLERGRNLLRRRLERRGIQLPAAFLVLGLASERIRASLWAKTIQSILHTPSPTVAALAQAGLPAMAAGTLKLALVGLATLLMTAGAAGVIGRALTEKPPEAPAAPPQAKAAPESKKPAAPRVRTDRHGDPLPDGALARLGTVRWRHGFFVQALAYSPNGKMIAAVGAGRAITLWDAASGKEIHQFPNGDQPHSLAFSPNGKILATTGVSVCHLWDVATGKELRQLKGHQEVLRSVAFSPDGKTVATASADGTVRLWDPVTGEERRQLNDGSGEVCRLAYSPDGKWIASTSMDGTIHLWDPATGKEWRQLSGHKKAVWSIVFSPDSKQLASSSDDGAIRLWDAATGRQSRILAEELGEERPIAFSPDGALLAGGCRDGTIRLWEVKDGVEKRRWQAGAMSVKAIAFSPDSKTLASGAAWESIRLWDVATGRERHPSEEHCGAVNFLRFSPDGANLVSLGPERRLLRWDLATQTPRRQFSWTATGWSVFALSPDGHTLAACGWPHYELHLWDTRTGKAGRLLGKFPNRIAAIAFSPDSRLLASANEKDGIHVWDVRDGKEIRHIKGFTSGMMGLRFSPDSKALACGIWARNKPSLRLWNVADGKERCAFDCFDSIGSLAFSSDGKVLATGIANNRYNSLVRLWDTASGKELCHHTGHRDDVGAIAFSPDGKLVASGAGSAGYLDNSVHIWEAATGQLIRRFEGHHSCVNSVAFAPDGLTVASGAGDSTILLWDITGRRADGRWHGKPLTPRQLDTCWTVLIDEDAAKAYDAMWMLSASAEQGVPILAKHLRPVPRPDAKIVSRLIADLASDNFTVRQRAMKELSKFGDAITPILQRTLEDKPALEMRRRVQQLLNQSRDWTPEHLREHRAIQALEHIGTPIAKELLQALAAGAAGAHRTEEAKAILQRLAR